MSRSMRAMMAAAVICTAWAVRSETLSGHKPEEKASLHNWMCQECSAIVQSKDRPSASGCPSKKHHRWNDLGEAGNTAYQCRKCNVLVESKEKPSSSYCPSGGQHQWNRLTR